MKELKADYPELVEISEDVYFYQMTKPNFEYLDKLRVVQAVQARNEARVRKDFKMADFIRDQLHSFDIILIDSPKGTKITLSDDFEPKQLNETLSW